MGLLDNIMSGMGASPGAKRGGLGGTVAAGVLLALAVKAVRQYQATHPEGVRGGRSFDPQAGGAPQSAPAQGGGLLGGMLGGAEGAGLGGLLGGLGGAGALGRLISQFQRNGFGQQANSWVGTGDNQPIPPNQLAQALGDDTVQQLQQQTGVPREQLLSELAHELPQAVHEVTPDGRLPDDAELHQIAQQPAPGARH
jgi:uncharacterized protein YidB (DUF937 family)